MRKLTRQREGIVAISTLLVSSVLLILISTLLVTLRNENHLVLKHANSTEALFLAEAAVADATYQLSLNNRWAPVTPLEVTFPDGNGKYTIVFDNDRVVEPHESVNNLRERTLTDGPRGLATVPPHTVDVVVMVELKGRVHRFEALISRGFSDPASVPLLSSGRIILEGEVLVSGIESLVTPIPVDAGIHTNLGGDTARAIDWDGNGDDAFISGEVSTVSGNLGAVRARGGDFNVGGVETGQPAMQFPIIDVDTAIRTGRYAPTMTPSGGGTTTLTGRDYKWDGGTINGDLELDGVNLFVDGDLEVNGTIKGTGAIYVKGDTSFRGNSEFVVSNDQTLALFSKGHVSLEGFDGSQFLDDLAADEPATFGKWNDDAKWAHGEAIGIVADPDNYKSTGGDDTTWGGTAGGNHFDQVRGVLGDATADPIPGREQDALGKMATYLADNYSGNESADFLVERLGDTRKLYENGAVSALPQNEILRNYRDGEGDYRGVLDILNRDHVPRVARQGASEVGLQNFDRLGTSYFQGLIYTNGAVYASNEVEIVGALLVHQNNDSPGEELRAGGESLNAGDVYLEGGSSLVYNQRLMEDPFASAPTGPVVVCSWLGR
jgi:hypothetical protein